MSISTMRRPRSEYSSGRPDGNAPYPAADGRRSTVDAHALAGRPRVAGGDLPERGDAADLPPDGGDLPERAHIRLPRRDRGRRRPRRADEAPALGAGPGRDVPARGRGVPRPHAPRPLSGLRLRTRAKRACASGAGEGKAGRPGTSTVCAAGAATDMADAALTRAESGALAHASEASMCQRSGRGKGWAILDSNQGPPPYQSGALTS